MEDRHFSLSEVAIGLRVSERTVRRWIKAGKLKAYKPGRDFRIPESAVRELVEKGEVSPKARAAQPLEPSLFNGLEAERRQHVYLPWLEYISRYADRWEARIASGDFDMGNVNEFIATLEDLQPTLNRLGLQEKREQPPGHAYSFGPIMDEAIGRLMDLLNPLIEAGVAKFDNSEFEQKLRRKRAEQESAFGEHIRRGA
jgi:excisionase family DNA binding protein